MVRSWLLDLAARALEEDQSLADIKPWVADSGEGRWTVFESIDLDVPAPVITLAIGNTFCFVATGQPPNMQCALILRAVFRYLLNFE